MFASIRKAFPHAAQFVSPTSISFKRRKPPEVLISRLDVIEAGRRPLVKFIKEQRSKTAFLFYGPGAMDFLRINRKHLLGSIAEVLHDDLPEPAVIQRLHAMVELRKAVCSVDDPQTPLIGRSQEFIDLVSQMLRLSRFPDPVLIRSDAPAEAISVANEIHRRSGRRGKINLLRVASLDLKAEPTLLTPADEQSIVRIFERSRNGTVIAENIGLLTDSQLRHLMRLVDATEQVRFISILNPTETNRLVEIPPELESFAIELQGISRRVEDVPLFVHYFTLLHNLQLEKASYFSQAEVDALMQQGVASISQLKAYVFDKLGQKFSTEAVPGFTHERKTKTLDQYVAEFEANIITDTLRHCGGNKSKAARLLGLRPNTLHYKLSRLGINANPENKK
jgi:DNA-binding NtrC family response regulator